MSHSPLFRKQVNANITQRVCHIYRVSFYHAHVLRADFSVKLQHSSFTLFVMPHLTAVEKYVKVLSQSVSHGQVRNSFESLKIHFVEHRNIAEPDLLVLKGEPIACNISAKKKTHGGISCIYHLIEKLP